MFASIFLVCGLSVQAPAINEGCALVSGKVPFSTREECVDMGESFKPILLDNLPEGAFVASHTCANLAKSA